MSSSCRIAIVGGGLAGLATANALRTFGIEAEVFETAPALGEIGAAVNVSPQAVKALRGIGVGDKIAAIGYSSPGIYTRNMHTGEFLEFNDRPKTAARYGAPYYSFHRADLLAALAEHPGWVYDRDHLLIGVWGYSSADVETRVVDQHVANLRRKLEAAGAEGQLETVRGVGYRLVARDLDTP